MTEPISLDLGMIWYSLEAYFLEKRRPGMCVLERNQLAIKLCSAGCLLELMDGANRMEMECASHYQKLLIHHHILYLHL